MRSSHVHVPALDAIFDSNLGTLPLRNEQSKSNLFKIIFIDRKEFEKMSLEN
jgi:hypothetical protein